MGLLLSLSLLVLLEILMLCITAVMSSLIKVYAMHAKCKNLIQSSDSICGKTRCIDQFLENISSRDGRVFRPSFLEAQETVQEASEAQLVMHICFTLHSPRTIKGEVLRGSERVCIHKTTEVLKSLWGTCSHHCFTSLFESLFLFCSLPQQLYLSREK